MRKIVTDNILPAHIDDLSAQIFLFPPDVHAIAQMNMTVEQISGPIFFHQIQKGGEAPVDKILGITHSGGSCVGHHNIHALGLAKLSFEFADAFLHLLLGELVGTAGVFDTAAQA